MTKQFEHDFRCIEELLVGLSKAYRESDQELSYKLFSASQMCAEVIEQQKPVETELEGGGTTWWYVCGDCHGAVDTRDIYCKHCGRRLIWDATKEASKTL